MSFKLKAHLTGKRHSTTFKVRDNPECAVDARPIDFSGSRMPGNSAIRMLTIGLRSHSFRGTAPCLLTNHSCARLPDWCWQNFELHYLWWRLGKGSFSLRSAKEHPPEIRLKSHRHRTQSDRMIPVEKRGQVQTWFSLMVGLYEQT